MDLKLPFGLKNNQLVHISEVERGIKCECSCPACGHPLVARKGNVRIDHFSHYKQSECEHGHETAIHLAAKELIEKAGYIVLPRYISSALYLKRFRTPTSVEPAKIYFDKISLEKKLQDIVPDILIEKAGRLLCVEIYVTHKVDDKKINKLKEKNISAIELDLSKINLAINFELLREVVVDSLENKKWLFNSKDYNLQKAISDNLVKKKIIYAINGVKINVENCPAPEETRKKIRPFVRKDAYMQFKCEDCKFFVRYDSEDGSYGDYVYCIGHKTEKEINNLLNMYA